MRIRRDNYLYYHVWKFFIKRLRYDLKEFRSLSRLDDSGGRKLDLICACSDGRNLITMMSMLEKSPSRLVWFVHFEEQTRGALWQKCNKDQQYDKTLAVFYAGLHFIRFSSVSMARKGRGIFSGCLTNNGSQILVYNISLCLYMGYKLTAVTPGCVQWTMPKSANQSLQRAPPSCAGQFCASYKNLFFGWGGGGWITFTKEWMRLNSQTLTVLTVSRRPVGATWSTCDQRPTWDSWE